MVGVPVTILRMSLLTIEQIRAAIQSHEPAHHPIGPETRQAAVAVILKPVEDHAEALFILRAQKEGDPWSGHMAFPGGHREPDDDTLQAAAVRETWEEIGLDLDATSSYIGELDMVQAQPRGHKRDMIVSPFVFELNETVFDFKPNYEVADILWGSLKLMHAGHNHGMRDFEVGNEVVTFPGYDVGDQVVWGMTYRMIESMLRVLDPDWVPH